MALTRQKKNKIVETLTAHSAQATALFGIEFKGIKTKELTEIRQEFRADQSALVMIAKNTLRAKALGDTDFAEVGDKAKGNIMYVFALKEPPIIAKKIVEQTKTYENFVPKFAVVEKQFYDQDGVVKLSKLPTRDVALAQLLSVMQAPIGALARTFNEIPARFVRLVDAVGRSKS